LPSRYRPADGKPNLLALQRETGFLNGKVDVKSHADFSLIEAAARRLH
jgi:hypothetical protein